MAEDGDGSASHIMEAVREGDVDVVSAFLDAGGKVNLCSPSTGRTLLHVACRQGYAEVVSLLLAKGANVGATTLRHLTPLHLASHEGHFRVSRLLLEAWAPVDDRDKAGTSPLHLASQKGHMDVVRLLLQCGADKDGVDESGWAPLHFAAWKGHSGVARMLLQAGANARACDLRQKSTALHIACAWGHPEVAKVLLEFGADSSAADNNSALPDHAIGAGSQDEVDPTAARELSHMILEHRTKIKGKYASSSLECVVDSLRAKVCELEDQLARAGRDRLELVAYSKDDNHRTFSAALKPECPICQVEVKEAVLDPCRHLAACCSCAESLPSCPFCACLVRGYEHLESTNAFARMAALEDEGAGLRAQLERFSRRIRDLVTTNGELRLDVRRARADALILSEERRALEERFLPPPASPPSVLSLAVSTADSDCGSFSPPSLVRRHAERFTRKPDVDKSASPGGGDARGGGARASTGEWNMVAEESPGFQCSRTSRGRGETSTYSPGSSALQSIDAVKANSPDPFSKDGEVRSNVGNGIVAGAGEDSVRSRRKSWSTRTAENVRPNTLVSLAIKGSGTYGSPYKPSPGGTTSPAWGTPTVSHQRGNGTPADTNRGLANGGGSSRDDSRDNVVKTGHVRASTHNGSGTSVGGYAYKPYPGEEGPRAGGTLNALGQHGSVIREVTKASSRRSSAPLTSVNNREQSTKFVCDALKRIDGSDNASGCRSVFSSRNSKDAETPAIARSNLQVSRATSGSGGSEATQRTKSALWDGNSIHDVFENIGGGEPAEVNTVSSGGKPGTGVGVVDAAARTITQRAKVGGVHSNTTNDYALAKDEITCLTRVCNDTLKTTYSSFSEDDDKEPSTRQGSSLTGVDPTVSERLGGGGSTETNTGGGESSVDIITRAVDEKFSVSDEENKLGETAYSDSNGSCALDYPIPGQAGTFKNNKTSAFNQSTIGNPAETITTGGRSSDHNSIVKNAVYTIEQQAGTVGDVSTSTRSTRDDIDDAGGGSVFLARARSNRAVGAKSDGGGIGADPPVTNTRTGETSYRTRSTSDVVGAGDQAVVSGDARSSASSDSFGAAGDVVVLFSGSTRSSASITNDSRPSLPSSSRASTSSIGNTSNDILLSRHTGGGAMGGRGDGASVEAVVDGGDVPRKRTSIRGRQRVRRRRVTGETATSAAKVSSPASTECGSVFSHGRSVSDSSCSPVVLQRLSSDKGLATRPVAINVGE